MSYVDQKADENLQKMKALEGITDLESSHWDADEILCDMLNSMGFNELVDAYNKLDKWYA